MSRYDWLMLAYSHRTAWKTSQVKASKEVVAHLLMYPAGREKSKVVYSMWRFGATDCLWLRNGTSIHQPEKNAYVKFWQSLSNKCHIYSPSSRVIAVIAISTKPPVRYVSEMLNVRCCNRTGVEIVSSSTSLLRSATSGNPPESGHETRLRLRQVINTC
jgi:hypothetical protein